MRRLAPLTLTAVALGASPAGAAPLLDASDARSFRSLERSLGGSSGITVSGVGRGQPVQRLGSFSSGVAWSTMKVPIVLAVLTRDNGRPSSSTRALMRRAITASDNNAALSLWNSLGGGSTAGAKVGRALAAAGDTSTRVQTRQIRPPYTPFGQTVWPLVSQQRFVAGLPCVPHASQVLALMGEVISSQRWGFGTIAKARFKGGWGPGTSGGYLVRQMGLFRLADGTRVAATMATLPGNGDFGTGSANLSRIARWLYRHVNAAAVPAKRC
jgi:hypothetical protein